MTRPPDPDWTDHDVFDRGKAEFFHGRESILRWFQKACARAVKTRGGTTFLIEGAPGAGKSALLIECGDRAARHGWHVANKMVPSAFCDVAQMRKQMGQLRYFQVENGTFGFTDLMKLTAQSAVTRPVDALGKDGPPLLLVLDEAQNLRTVSARANDDHTKATAIETIQLIHNGLLERPVMLLAGGLGTTTDVFDDLGVSRFEGECHYVLGALEPDAERAVLHDWLKIRGEALGDPAAWIEAIMEETYGWPQHTIAYLKPAMRQLAAHTGVMTSHGLAHVLQVGREKRTQYYLQRTRVFSSKQLRALVRAFPAGQPGALTSDDAIMASLTASFPQHGEAERLFDRAVAKGVIMKQGGEYVIPIPSMHTWLENTYGGHQLATDTPTLGGWLDHERPSDLGLDR